MNAKSPLSLVCVSRVLPVASFTSVTFTLARTAPLGSATRPRILPPVLWATRKVEETKQRTTSQRLVQRAIDEDMGNLRAAGRSFKLKSKACAYCKPCYNRARLEAISADCQAKNSATTDR